MGRSSDRAAADKPHLPQGPNVRPSPPGVPVPLTRFFGREQEIAQIERMLREDGQRLVTLTGPAGTGKTRLGLQVAANVLAEFPDGAFFVDLVPIRDPNLVVSTIAQLLGLRETGGQALLESLEACLREKQIFLLLDNFEHVIAAASQVADLLAAAPRLKVLVTSREALRLRGEQEFPIAPLPVPDPRRLPGPEAISEYAVVKLFAERAINVHPSFSITHENAPAIAEICRRLDGLPLAIELAAARVKLFPPPVLLLHLESPLKILVHGARDLPLRQQTLRNAIAWSYDLLAEDEKTFFRRLSVLVGGFTVAAAEAVCDPEGNLAISALDGLASLAEKNLLRQEEHSESEPRFGMLETIRAFAREQLDESDELPSIRKRHAQYFMTFAEEAEQESGRTEIVASLNRMEREHDNLRAALAWAIETGEAEIGLRLGSALEWFWSQRSHLSEGRQWLDQILAQSSGAPAPLRAKVLFAAGDMAFQQGDFVSAVRLTQQALELFGAGEDKVSIARAYFLLGFVARQHADYAAARSYWMESLALWQGLDNKREAHRVTTHLLQVVRFEQDNVAVRRLQEQEAALMRDLQRGADAQAAATRLINQANLAEEYGDRAPLRSLYHQATTLGREWGADMHIAAALQQVGLLALNCGDYLEAASLFEECVRMEKTRSQMTNVAMALVSLGRAARSQGDLKRAHGAAVESLRVAREMGAKVGIARALHDLGQVTLKQRDGAAARANFQESLALWCEIDSHWGTVESLEAIAYLAMAERQPERAARLLGAAESLRQTIGIRHRPFERTDYESSVVAIRASLGEEAFAEAWAAGQALSLEQAVAEALAELGRA
jgi:predicted ATPase